MHPSSLARSAFLRICLVVAMAVLFHLATQAQEAQPSARTSVAAQTAAPAAEKQPSAEEARQESKESGGGAAEAIRHAPAVRWIAKHTRFSIDQYYLRCIGFDFSVV